MTERGDPEERTLRATHRMANSQRESHQGKSILVVEDDAEIRETLDSLLRIEGYEVVTCANGLEALHRLRSGAHADVILLDLMMPVMDGWQFRVQQKRDPDLASLPVIAISADSTPKAAAIDADAYLKKPVDYDTLIDTIERTLLAMERKLLQARLAETDRLTSLGTLAAGVAHEINNPLAYVMANMTFVANAFPQLLARAARPEANGSHSTNHAGDEDDQLGIAIAEAREGCERIRSIVRDLQLFSRPEHSERAQVDVRAALDSSINIVLNEVRTRARLVKDYREVPLVIGNRARLGQVFLNLVLNAAQAIPEGKQAENEVRVTTYTDEEGDAIIEVRDSGEGIRPEVRARIFDPFFTTKPIGVGTGLGLSISHGIIAAMGGDLSVETQVGKGSVFRVALPASRQARRVTTPPPPRPVVRRGRVLVVDDEEMICLTLSRVLSHTHDVHTNTHPREALARIVGGERFDVILCDLMMPELSGMELYEAVREVDPEQAERIVFLTGGAFTARAQAFTAQVQNTFVEKPFDVDKLMAIVSSRVA